MKGFGVNINVSLALSTTYSHRLVNYDL